MEHTKSDNREAWWKSPEAHVLSAAEDAVDNAFDDWQKVRQQMERQIVREWQLYPDAPMFQTYDAFMAALNEEVARNGNVQQAWQRFVTAVQEQHRALHAWLTALEGEEGQG